MDQTLPFALPLDGASNVRDLGGWRVADGRRVRPGMVWRSAALHGLTEADLARLAEAGIATVCDLRGEREAARAPSRLPPGAVAHPLPIEPFVGASLRDMLERGAATGEGAVELLRRAYLSYVSDHLDAYRRLFALLLDEARRPLLFHCSAGKDRTGIGAALVLTVLGADRATVMADYVATDRLWRRDHPLPPGTPQAAADAILSTHPAMLEEALDAVLARFDGVEGLAADGLGLSRSGLASFREALLD
ncbi:tyrosine-protein phosphatase [Roseomonas sp. PWR1]|uniref:Tyrosine-protein phosphatase n=1 Tax=Roseomonas nitratireducens TaxID=2820810 RepID=A0ABS4ARE4_9PROT|nr:tyrosine-protein phosphatase [Neoroseomonas nitratireducens]MBP0463406.1 tyrosine-protein phosphatase [Neoroseomonas nitratireducens]